MFLGRVCGDNFGIEEIYRFDNRPILKAGRYAWDIGHIYKETINGLKQTKKHASEITSAGVDSWGVDFGLVGADGTLIKNPYSYRDSQVASTLNQILKRVSKREIFTITGINHWNVTNTLWQYHYLSKKEPELLREADRAVMIAQLLSYLLGGDMCAEETLASTTQMVDVNSRNWSDELAKRFELPLKFPEIRETGDKIGALKNEVTNAVGFKTDLVLPASHDTASAVAGMPLRENEAFLSTGTWFMVGVEIDKPCLTEEAFRIGASNESGIEGTTRFLKDIAGFFLLEQCRKAWRKRGHVYDYDELTGKVLKTKSFGPLIDPDDPSFTIEANMPSAIVSYCQRTKQEAPKDEGEIARCIFESIAVKTAVALGEITRAAKVRSKRLYLCGGCFYNDLLCQMISSAASIPVYAGPAQSTVAGNVLVQAQASSEIKNIKEGRHLIEKSFKIKKFEPEKDERWEEAKEKMKGLIEKYR